MVHPTSFYTGIVYARLVWHSLGEFLLQLHAQGLGHEAVIEIMIALLGVMIAVLTLISGLLAVGVTVIGIFGYQTIRDEAARRAEIMAKKIAAKVAKATATQIANAIKQQVADETQASGLSETQAEQPATIASLEAAAASRPKRRRATTDRNLKEGGEL
jgi:cytochrome bd-type quinol oxidase subunit 1